VSCGRGSDDARHRVERNRCRGAGTGGLPTRYSPFGFGDVAPPQCFGAEGHPVHEETVFVGPHIHEVCHDYDRVLLPPFEGAQGADQFVGGGLGSCSSVPYSGGGFGGGFFA